MVSPASVFQEERCFRDIHEVAESPGEGRVGEEAEEKGGIGKQAGEGQSHNIRGHRQSEGARGAQYPTGHEPRELPQRSRGGPGGEEGQEGESQAEGQRQQEGESLLQAEGQVKDRVS